MPVVNLGPCNCCGGTPGPCSCSLTPCHEPKVVIAGTGSGMDGTWYPVWNAGASQWEWTMGSCTWILGNTGPYFITPLGLADPAHGFNARVGVPCSQSGGIASYVADYAYNGTAPSENCGFGTEDLGGGTATISWDCRYPEYLTISANVTGSSGECDCDVFDPIDAPIDCVSSTPISDLQYTVIVDTGSCYYTAGATWNCSTKVLTVHLTWALDYADYRVLDVSYMDLLGGGPFVLTQYDASYSFCSSFPATLTVTPQNNGVWCP